MQAIAIDTLLAGAVIQRASQDYNLDLIISSSLTGQVRLNGNVCNVLACPPCAAQRVFLQVQYGMLLSPELYEYPALNLDDRFQNGETNVTSMGLCVRVSRPLCYLHGG